MLTPKDLEYIPTQYNYHIQIQYNDNTEYRKCFRDVFRIDTERIIENLKKIYTDFDNFEDETKDELIFDDDKVNQIMGEIIDNTEKHEIFRELYKKAASFMISEDLEIGLSILLSYDYLQYFHSVLIDWFHRIEKCENLDNFSITSAAYIKLREHLFKPVK